MTGAPERSDRNTIDSKDCRNSMSVDRLDQAATPATRPSVHVERARKLLLGGAVLFFYTVGQLVMVAFADAGARTLLAVSMASYTPRVVALGLVLLVYNNNADALSALRPMAVFVTTIAVVAGWLAVEVFVFSRLRIGVYDTPRDLAARIWRRQRRRCVAWPAW